jgi:hypothetical protein
MNIKYPAIALLLAALPATTLAAPSRDGGGHYQSAPRQSYSRSYAAPQRSYSAPQRSYAAPQRSYAAPQRSYAAPQRAYVQPEHAYNGAGYTEHGYTQRSYVQPQYRYGGRVGRSAWGGNPWGWNGGREWVASPRYWGGGFWGAFGLGLAFGSVGYYEVQSGYPGYDLLANYGLTQTSCDQPNIVQIFGPDGSEICAYPNDMVAPGAYNVDPATLTLVSQ